MRSRFLSVFVLAAACAFVPATASAVPSDELVLSQVRSTMQQATAQVFQEAGTSPRSSCAVRRMLWRTEGAVTSMSYAGKCTSLLRIFPAPQATCSAVRTTQTVEGRPVITISARCTYNGVSATVVQRLGRSITA